jgi:outer membrane protein TolC
MLTHKAGVVGAALALLLLASGGACPGGPAGAAAAEPKDSRLRDLLREKLDVLTEVADQVEKAHKAGQVSREQVLQAKEAVLRAELDLCESDKERVAVLEKMAAAARQREEEVAKLVQAGQVPTSVLLRAKLARLDAEIALERAKAK